MAALEGMLLPLRPAGTNAPWPPGHSETCHQHSWCFPEQLSVRATITGRMVFQTDFRPEGQRSSQTRQAVPGKGPVGKGTAPAGPGPHRPKPAVLRKQVRTQRRDLNSVRAGGAGRREALTKTPRELKHRFFLSPPSWAGPPSRALRPTPPPPRPSVLPPARPGPQGGLTGSRSPPVRRSARPTRRKPPGGEQHL